MLRILAAALVLLFSALLPAAAEGKRIALVIGMGQYQHLSSLENPVPDAKAIAAELRAHGFEVSEYYNLDRADLLDALETFKRQAEDAEVALVYYAGHGMEIEGKNVVAPTDMEVSARTRPRSAPSISTSYSPRPALRRSRSCCSTPAATIPSRNAPPAGRIQAAASAASRGRPRRTDRC